MPKKDHTGWLNNRLAQTSKVHQKNENTHMWTQWSRILDAKQQENRVSIPSLSFMTAAFSAPQFFCEKEDISRYISFEGWIPASSIHCSTCNRICMVFHMWFIATEMLEKMKLHIHDGIFINNKSLYKTGVRALEILQPYKIKLLE